MSWVKCPGRARIKVLPAGLGQWMLNWLGKVYLSCKNKYCHGHNEFSLGPLGTPKTYRGGSAMKSGVSSLTGGRWRCTRLLFRRNLSGHNFLGPDQRILDKIIVKQKLDKALITLYKVSQGEKQDQKNYFCHLFSSAT